MLREAATMPVALLLLVASCPAHTRMGRVDLWNAAEQEFLKAELW